MALTLPRPLTRANDEEPLSLQLEGALEVLQEARQRYAEVEGVLRGWGWQWRADEHRALLLETLAAEPQVEEALARLLRRAQQQGWPPRTPALVEARALRREREWLEAQVRGRLGSLGAPPVSGLSAALRELEARIARTTPPPLRPGERVVMEGEPDRGLLRVAQLGGVGLVYGLFFLTMGAPLGSFGPGLRVVALAAGAALVSVGLHLAWVQRSGVYRLTTERLFWSPSPSSVRELPLEALSPGDVRVGRWTRTVELGGGLRLAGVSGAGALAARLALLSLRRPQASGAPAPEASAPLVCEAVRSWPQSRRVAGAALVRADGVVFLPLGSAGPLFTALAGAPPPVPLPEALLLEALSPLLAEVRQSAAGGATLLRAGGELWPREETRVAVAAERPRRVHILRGAVELDCTLPLDRLGEAHPLLATYPRH